MSAGLRYIVKKLDDTGLQRILGADDVDRFFPDQLLEDFRFLSQLIDNGADVGPDGGADGSGSDTAANCPNMAGLWDFSYQCPMSASGQGAEVTQEGCQITSLWEDDRTPAVDTLTGTVDENGNTIFTIDFDDGPVTCTGSWTGGEWTSDCTPGDCQLTGVKMQ